MATTFQETLNTALKQFSEQMFAGVLQNLQPFFDKVADESDLSVERVQELFNETMGGVSTAGATKAVKGSRVKKQPKKVDDENVVLCDFVMTGRAKRAGEACGTKVTKDGMTRCSRHAGSRTEQEKKASAKKAE